MPTLFQNTQNYVGLVYRLVLLNLYASIAAALYLISVSPNLSDCYLSIIYWHQSQKECFNNQCLKACLTIHLSWQNSSKVQLVLFYEDLNSFFLVC